MSSLGINMKEICLEARNRLWYQNRPIEECFELLDSIMQVDDGSISEQELKQIQIEILEGRKIIVGINSGELIEDNEKVRPVIELVERQRVELKKHELEEDMRIHMYKYVDDRCPGFCVTPRITDTCSAGLITARNRHIDRILSYEVTLEQLARYRRYGVLNKWEIEKEYDYTDPLNEGMYLFYDLDLAFKVLGGKCENHREVVAKCDKYWSDALLDWMNEGVKIEDMTPLQKAVYSRTHWIQEQYKAKFNPYYKAETEEIEKITPVQPVERQVSEIDMITERRMEVAIHNRSNLNSKRPIRPDKNVNHLGFISPEGEWFSCKYGHHDSLASQILSGLSVKVEEPEGFKLKFSHYLNILLNMGYIQVQEPSEGPVFYKKDNNITQLQYQELYKHVQIYTDLASHLAEFLEKAEVETLN